MSPSTSPPAVPPSPAYDDARALGGLAQAGLAVTVSVAAVLVALFTLYAVHLDQGALLSPVLGQGAAAVNALHELAHDGRHLLGAPCH